MFAATEVIYCGDNRRVLSKYVPDESVDLVYIDPPFNTGRTYELLWGEASEKRAYEDRYGNPMQYLDWMTPRLLELHRVLKPTGSFYIHCDPTSSHYLKVRLDQIFGYRQFRNEIIWKRTTSHSDSRKRFGRVTDTILFYGKSDAALWNPQYQKHAETYVKSHYNNIDQEGRRYRLDNIIRSQSMGFRHNLTYEYNGFTPPVGWRVKREKLEGIDQKGRLYWSKNQTPYLIRYLDEQSGDIIDNLWTDILPVNSQALERRGYPTQKPLSLLERIITASSNEGYIVLDGFCGCGTTLEDASRLKRHWIGIDLSPTACRVMAERLEARCNLVERRDLRLIDLPRTSEELRRMPPFEFQNWAVTALGGIPNRVKTADFGIDGRLYVADQIKRLSEERNLFGQIGMEYFPIQVKQKDKAGRPDIDSFETAMQRDRRTRGYFISFDFTRDAFLEIGRAKREQGLEIIPVTVDEILRDEEMIYGEEPAEFSAAALRRQSIQPPLTEQGRLPEATPIATSSTPRKRRVGA